MTSDTGALVPPADPGALAAALIRMLQDPDGRAEMARASQVRHAEHFGLERMVGAVAGVYDDVRAGTG